MEFPLPKDLTRVSPTIKFNYLAIEKENFVVEFIDKDEKKQRISSIITGYKDQDKQLLYKLLESKLFLLIDESTIKSVIDKLADAIDNLYTSNTEAIKLIDKIKKKAEVEAKEREEKEENWVKKIYIQKYFDKSNSLLYEAVLIGGKPCFVYPEWDLITNPGDPTIKLAEKIFLPDATNPTIELLPPQKDQYLSKPFEFAHEKELNECLRLAEKETLDTSYQRQKNIASKYIDAPNTHLTILAANGIFTHFQDKLGQTHYLMFVGDNDTGKTANLTFLQHTGYRAMLDVDITAANIYGFLGNFEEGQGIILEDEADDIDRKPEKMKIYKAGYNAGKKVTRTDVSNYGRRTQSWNTFCFKAFTAEKAADNNTAKGFLDRTFIFHCIRGEPAYDITEVTNPAGDNEFIELSKELDSSRKLMFAFRLLHYQDPLPNIELSVKNREKQLCKPLLRLFQNAECQDEIGIALADLIGQKRGLKHDTLEAKILDVVTRIIEENQKTHEQRNVIDNTQVLITKWESNQISSGLLFEQVANELGGTYRRKGEDKSFETEEHGTVSHTQISRICVDKFGAESKRTNSVRYLEFDLEKLDKAKSAYIFPNKVEILSSVPESKNNVSEQSCDKEQETMAEDGRPRDSPYGNNEERAQDFSLNEAENENEMRKENTENSDDASDVFLPLESVGEPKNETGNGKSEHGTPSPEPRNTSLSNPMTNSLYTFKEKNTSQPSLHNSEELFQLVDENEETNPFVKVIKKATGYRQQQSGQKDYFTKDDFVYSLVMTPNEKWDEDNAEQTFYELLRHGKIARIQD
jgi:hypothetical protein